MKYKSLQQFFKQKNYRGSLRKHVKTVKLYNFRIGNLCYEIFHLRPKSVKLGDR